MLGRVFGRFLVLLIVVSTAWATDPLQVTTYLHDYQMFSVGDTLRQDLRARGGTPPYRWILDESTAPPGVRLGEIIFSGALTPALVGSLTQPGSWRVAVLVTDAAGAEAKAVLNIAVSTLRLVDRFIPAPAGQFIRVIPRVTGGTAPYRIALSLDTDLPLGLQFDSLKNEFYGTVAVPHGFGVSIEIRDSSDAVLRTVLGFGPTSGFTTNLSVGVLLEPGACGLLTVRTRIFSGASTTVDWADGTTEAIAEAIQTTRHKYARDGRYPIRLSVTENATGNTYSATYEVDIREVEYDLCRLNLGLKPHSLYLVRGKSAGRVRLDSRTAEGELYPLDASHFMWSSTKPSLVAVDEQGAVTCAGIGEGQVELVSREIPWRIRARVFCGEYTIEPALAQLSPVDGNNQVQLSVIGVGADGRRTRASEPVIRVVQTWNAPDVAPLIAVNANVAKVLRAPLNRSENVGIASTVDGLETRNWAVMRATAANLGMLIKPWRGENVTIWAPDQVLDLSYKDVLEKSEALRVADLIYLLEEEEAGLRPSQGGMQHLANMIGYENDPGTPCGGSGNPVGLGTRIDKPAANSCFIWDKQAPQLSLPHWNVWAHELGHNFHGESRKYGEWLGLPESRFLGLAASESIASHHDCYALWFLAERGAIYGVNGNFLSDWKAGCNFNRDFEDLKRYQATGPDFRKIDVGGFFDIMMKLRVEYGWEAQRRFFSVFLPAYEGFQFSIRTLEQQTSLFIAAYSAATRTDLQQRFVREFGFPIDEKWYDANYPEIERLVSQRDPSVTAGPGQTSRPGAGITLSQAAAFDPLDRPMTYQWKVTQQPPGSRPTLSDPRALNPQFTADTEGTYRLELIAADGLFTSKPSQTTITVASTPSISKLTADPPSVDIGQSSKLNWQSNLPVVVVSVAATPSADLGLPAPNPATSGTIVVRPVQTTLYNLTFRAADGTSISAATTVAINPPGFAAEHVVNMVDQTTALWPGAAARITGANLAAGEATADSPDSYPTTLNEVRVMFGDTPARLKRVSPGQVDLIVPPEMGANGDVWIQVVRGDSTSEWVRVWISEAPR